MAGIGYSDPNDWRFKGFQGLSKAYNFQSTKRPDEPQTQAPTRAQDPISAAINTPNFAQTSFFGASPFSLDNFQRITFGGAPVTALSPNTSVTSSVARSPAAGQPWSFNPSPSPTGDRKPFIGGANGANIANQYAAGGQFSSYDKDRSLAPASSWPVNNVPQKTSVVNWPGMGSSPISGGFASRYRNSLDELKRLTQ